MKLIRFSDNCLITRGASGKDAWDNDVAVENVYDGPCSYQEGGVTASRLFTLRAPTIFIPAASSPVQINDKVRVTTQRGRVIDGVVKVATDVELALLGDNVTRIELKQAQGD